MHTFLSIENVLLGRNTGGSYQIPNLSQALFGSARRVKLRTAELRGSTGLFVVVGNGNRKNNLLKTSRCG
jgi:hypothetical protein